MQSCLQGYWTLIGFAVAAVAVDGVAVVTNKYVWSTVNPRKKMYKSANLVLASDNTINVENGKVILLY